LWRSHRLDVQRVPSVTTAADGNVRQ
jgi:hypothetical protein